MKRINPYETPEYQQAIKQLKETKCCTVVSLWVATLFTRDIKDCFRYMQQHGRPSRKGMPLSKIKDALFSMKQFRVKEGPYHNNNRITLSQFIEKHPEGIFYVMNRNHAWVVWDGCVYDHSDKPKRQITNAFRIYPK